MKIFDRNYFLIILFYLLSCSLFLLSEYYYTDGKFGVPLDDSWIHFRFADNFAKGHFFEYNVGEPTAGTTSPLWLIILALISFVSSNFILVSKFLSVIFGLFTILIIYQISKSIFTTILEKENQSKFFALLVAGLTILNGRLGWANLSGMETTLFCFLSSLGIYFHIHNLKKQIFNYYPGLILSLAAVSRPEGILLFGMYILDSSLNYYFLNRKISKNFTFLFINITIFCSIVLPYFIFSYNLSGNFFPNTFSGQGAGFKFIPDLKYLNVSLIFFLRDNAIVLLLVLLSAFWYFKNIKFYFKKFKFVNLIFLWIIFLPIISSFVTPNWRHHGRYLLPLIPFLNFIAIFFIVTLKDKISNGKIYNFLFQKKLSYIILLIFSTVYYVIFIVYLGKNTDNINNQQVKIANWIKENIPQNETIALNDIGAITHLTNNRIIDVMGLVTPEILKYRTYNWNDNLDSTFYLLKNNNAKYLIIYDHWYEKFLERYGKHFEPIFHARLKENTICGGAEMTVYKINYNIQN